MTRLKKASIVQNASVLLGESNFLISPSSVVFTPVSNARQGSTRLFLTRPVKKVRRRRNFTQARTRFCAGDV